MKTKHRIYLFNQICYCTGRWQTVSIAGTKRHRVCIDAEESSWVESFLSVSFVFYFTHFCVILCNCFQTCYLWKMTVWNVQHVERVACWAIKGGGHKRAGWVRWADNSAQDNSAPFWDHSAPFPGQLGPCVCILIMYHNSNYKLSVYWILPFSWI